MEPVINKLYAPQVLWITGLSGAGKSTLAREVVAILKNKHDSVVMLDGDELREVFGVADLNVKNHGREARLRLAMQYSQLCRVLSNQGMIVVIATISLFKEVHIWNRQNLPGYFEVFLNTPLEELRRRDPKGIYRSFYSGELSNVAGLDLPIDVPDSSDWVVEFDQERSVGLLARDLINKWTERNSL